MPVRSGSWAAQMRRSSMEDEHVRMDRWAGIGALYGVFDGHSGGQVAAYAKERLPKLLEEEVKDAGLSSAAIGKGICEAFLRVDEEIYHASVRDEMMCSGSTALVALVMNERLFIGNAGDSRAVLCRAGKAVRLSTDHTASMLDPKILQASKEAGETSWEDTQFYRRERKRVKAAGGEILKLGYLNGVLAITRALGDWRLGRANPAVKKMVGGRNVGPMVAEPQVSTLNLQEQDEFLLLCSDGMRA